MIETVLAECRRLTPQDEWVDSIQSGTFEISDGSLSLPLADGQYFRIVGSCFNDGIYQYPAAELNNETFTGVVWGLRLPHAFIDDCAKISDWTLQNSNVGGIQSESFGGYSYTKRSSRTGGAWTWRDEFANVLRRYRKLGQNVWR